MAARHGSHPPFLMDLLLVRYTTFVWAPYNLSLISSGDMGLFFYNMFWIWGWAEPNNSHCGASRARRARVSIFFACLGLFMKSVSAMYSFGKTGHGHFRFRRLNLELVFFFFFLLLDSSMLSSIRCVLHCDRRWRNLLVLIFFFGLRGLGSLWHHYNLCFFLVSCMYP